MEESKYGVHRTHCCALHGCKYCDDNCPVENGTIKQDYTCEWCDDDGITSVDEIHAIIESKNKSYYIVDYNYTTGEYGIPKQKLVEGNIGQDKDEILDSYFEGFFDEETYREDDCYWASDGCQVIRITSMTPVPYEDALVLKKYLK